MKSLCFDVVLFHFIKDTCSKGSWTWIINYIWKWLRHSCDFHHLSFSNNFQTSSSLSHHLHIIVTSMSLHNVNSCNNRVSRWFYFKILTILVQRVVGHGSSITFENDCVTAAIFIIYLSVTIFKLHHHYLTIYTSLSLLCRCITLIHVIIVFRGDFISKYWQYLFNG